MTNFDGSRSSVINRFPVDPTAPPSTEDGAGQALEGLAFEDDLAMFTNAHFFDFDLGETVNPAPTSEVPVVHVRRPSAAAGLSRPEVNPSGLEAWRDDFQFAEVPSFQTLLADPASASAPPAPGPIRVPDVIYPLTTLPSPATVSGGKGSEASPPARTGEKRRAAESSPPVEAVHGVSSPATSLEDASRMAAEEDKRRRNTAASARFRIKKKQREQTLERTAKEMTEKVSQLEARIGQLETENKWLKNLITEKNDNKDDVVELWRKRNTPATAAAASATTQDRVVIKTESDN